MNIVIITVHSADDPNEPADAFAGVTPTAAFRAMQQHFVAVARELEADDIETDIDKLVAANNLDDWCGIVQSTPFAHYRFSGFIDCEV